MPNGCTSNPANGLAAPFISVAPTITTGGPTTICTGEVYCLLQVKRMVIHGAMEQRPKVLR
jgi:hypothetical protein